MIDWCVQCADAGCLMTKHKDAKHRMFAYIFVRIMKDALINNNEQSFFRRESENAASIWVLDEKFYQLFIKDEPVGQIVEKFWFKKSYWDFMRHMIDDSVNEQLWKKKYKVIFFKSKKDKEYGRIFFMFGGK